MIKNLCTLLIIALVYLSGCSVTYSFREGSIPSDIHSIAIRNFNNESGNGPPNLTQVFSETLRNFYQSNTRLNLVNNNADWELEGSIVGYSVTPVAPQAGELTGLNRLTVTVNARFTNNKDEEQSFEQPFNFYFDFEQNQTLTQVENEALNVIFNQIVLDIFNRSTSTW
ncbi:LptE family protein [Cytophagaceae bacterium ABcell3]|nr:LptE family protein [Cytophagaceae bacterium ABcell3]